MNEQLSTSLAWIDRLHEVGQPIRDRRAAILDLLDKAERLERQALAMRGRAIGEHFALIDAVLRNWTEEEVARARSAAASEQPRPGEATQRPVGELCVRIDGIAHRVSIADAPADWREFAQPPRGAAHAMGESAEVDLMRVAIELALRAFDSPTARNPLRDIDAYKALQAMYQAIDRPWPTHSA